MLNTLYTCDTLLICSSTHHWDCGYHYRLFAIFEHPACLSLSHSIRIDLKVFQELGEKEKKREGKFFIQRSFQLIIINTFIITNMSLSLRFGAVTSLQESLWGLVPRLPSITIRLGLQNKLGNQQSLPMDERLRELKEKIEESGEAPFMIDNGTILKAVPKKKMSRARRRKKLYASGNKQVHPINNIVRCSACGSVKRSHFMCMNCFAEIRTFLKSLKRKNGLLEEPVNPQSDLNPLDERVIYPGKFETDEQRRLKSKDWVPQREEAGLYNHQEVKHIKKSNKGPVMVKLE